MLNFLDWSSLSQFVICSWLTSPPTHKFKTGLLSLFKREEGKDGNDDMYMNTFTYLTMPCVDVFKSNNGTN